MMLFGDLKAGGWLTITVVDDKITLVAKPKASKVPLLTVDTATENAVQDN
jgi:hypothetical protein